MRFKNPRHGGCLGARGLAWPILGRLGRLDSGSNPDGPTLFTDGEILS